MIERYYLELVWKLIIGLQMALFPLLFVKKWLIFFALTNEKIAHFRLKDQNPNKLLMNPSIFGAMNPFDKFLQPNPNSKLNLSISHIIELSYLLFYNKYTILLLLPLLFATSAYTQSKIKGINFRGPDEAPLTSQMVEGIKLSHANWVGFTPAAILHRQNLKIEPENRRYHWYETEDFVRQAVRLASEQGYQILLKPHIKLLPIDSSKNQVDRTHKAKWRGDLKFQQEADWQMLQQEYEKYILHWASIADDLAVQIFCIGTELKQFATQRPEFWMQLIPKIRAVYDGQIIYSANWDEYGKIEFWEALDYIGLNAYFPISLSRVPKTRKVRYTWRWYLKRVHRVSKAIQKPVIITEFGYRNRDFAALQPWLHESVDFKVNHQAQENLYAAFFQAAWRKKWLLGVFIWQWQAVTPSEPDNTLFTPQGKPALKVLQKWYQEE